MMRKRTLTAVLLALAGAAINAGAADVVKKVHPKPASARAEKVLPLEKFTCRTGPNDEQVRLIVEAVKGRAMEFAFYSRLGTRVCSIHSRRGDGATQWQDADGTSGKALIKLFTGHALVEYKSGQVKVTFSDVDRMHYCGMYGELNGLIEAVQKKPECGMQGLFEGAGSGPDQKDKAPAPGS
ncbi:MAG: hypothetical protein JWN94_3164 [Betaproteobacteria bacterium]|nr:hypothetical protein [Betaproteobacteria bacterium]